MLTPEQKETRKNGVGASDSPIIMGFSSFKTPYFLYLEKLGLIEDTEETEQMYWGNMLESKIIEHFRIVNDVWVDFPDTIYHPSVPFMFANLDGYIHSRNAVVEVKNSSSYMRQEWGEPGTDVIPMQYLIQVAHQCIVTDADMGYLAVLIGGNEYRQFEYKRDDELELMICNSVGEFWLGHVQKQIPPSSITIEDSRLKYKDVDPESVKIADIDICFILERLDKFRELQKQNAAHEERAKMAIMEYMKECECLTDETGKPLVTLKADKKGNRRFLLK